MNGSSPTPANNMIYYRLIALWAAIETMLGGIIHGLRIPVSGIFLGSGAVICISLIGWYRPQKGSILKATMIVAILKMMMSPQAPVPAYFAVFFQGMMGELLFVRRQWFRISCYLLAMIALMESGLQRILVLTLVYGKAFWAAINSFINGITGQESITNYSLLLVLAYLGLHFAAGLVTGRVASRLPQRVIIWGASADNLLPPLTSKPTATERPRKKRKWLKKGLMGVWLVLLMFYLQSNYHIGKPLLPTQLIWQIFIRSMLIVLTWVFLLGPLLAMLLRKWLERKTSQSAGEIQTVLRLLPATRELVAESWKRASEITGWKRISRFIRLLLVNALRTPGVKSVIILTGETHSGKTTALWQWSETGKEAAGVLSPVINGKRMFMDLESRETFPMESLNEGEASYTVGKYVFSRSGFDWAADRISRAWGKSGWLIIDELGPLELRSEGFAGLLKQMMSQPINDQKLLLVVREGLVDRMIEEFHLVNAVVIRNTRELS